LGSQLKIKHPDPLFNQFAVHNWFEGVVRGTGEAADYIQIHVLPMPRSWAWLIPISERVTSVGVITEASDFVKGHEPVEDYFRYQASTHPRFAAQMQNAHPLHQFTREANYSYFMDRFAGPGWLLVGDAARFVDPVFSSGVSVAMESAKRAGAAIIAAFENAEVSPAPFAQYEAALRAGVEIWREFIHLYYQLPPLFLDLLNRPDTRVQLTQLLQGDVYERASVPILEEMKARVASVRQNPNHPWHSHLYSGIGATTD
jgi:FADH2 O2-dependent halogenase